MIQKLRWCLYDSIAYLLIFVSVAYECKVPLDAVQTWVGWLVVNAIWEGTKLAYCTGETYLAVMYGGIDGDHHKAWVIDQMVRVLAGDEYEQIVRKACDGEDGPETYSWNEGIAP